jgi:hypothetical protein
VLSDAGNAVAASYRLVMTIPDAIRQHQVDDLGIDLAVRNGAGTYDVPLPGTYVIDTDGTIALANVDPDYRQRLDPEIVLATLRRLRGSSPGVASTDLSVLERLAALEDREAIRDVLHRYARGADRRDVTLMKSCYWPDATDCHWFFNGNAHAFCEYVVEQLLQVDNSQHSITNAMFDFEGDRAFVESQWYLVHHIPLEDGEDSRCLAQQGEGRYIDVFERRHGLEDPPPPDRRGAGSRDGGHTGRRRRHRRPARGPGATPDQGPTGAARRRLPRHGCARPRGRRRRRPGAMGRGPNSARRARRWSPMTTATDAGTHRDRGRPLCLGVQGDAPDGSAFDERWRHMPNSPPRWRTPARKTRYTPIT